MIVRKCEAASIEMRSMSVWEIFGWLNPLDSLYDAIADKLGFPVDQVSIKKAAVYA